MNISLKNLIPWLLISFVLGWSLETTAETAETAFESFKQGNYKSALEKWQKKLHKEPDNQKLLYNIGLSHARMDNGVLAKLAFENAHRLASDESKVN